MKLSELIEAAAKVMEEHGDIPVVVPDAGCGCCRSYDFEPASVDIQKDAPSYDEKWVAMKLPVAFVVS